MKSGAALLAVALLVLAGCTTTVQGTPAPDSKAPALAHYLHADPCGFVPSSVFSGFATVSPPEPSFDSCLVYLRAPSGKGILTSVELESGRHGVTTETTTVGGLTVYREPDDVGLCAREIVVTTGLVISVYATGDPQPCAVADAMTTAVAKTVHDGAIAQTHYPASSLATRDACSVLHAPRAPGAAAEQYPGFAGHTCTWGRANGPNVWVRFTLDTPADGHRPGAGAITIEGRNASMEFVPAQRDVLPACVIAVDFQPTAPPRDDRVESAWVRVTTDLDPDQVCGQAKDLATEMIRNLSG